MVFKVAAFPYRAGAVMRALASIFGANRQHLRHGGATLARILDEWCHLTITRRALGSLTPAISASGEQARREPSRADNSSSLCACWWIQTPGTARTLRR